MSQLNVDLIKNRTGTAGPTVPSLTVTGGVNATGIVTASSISSPTISNSVSVTGGVNATGIVTSSQFVKSGGTSNQFLKADGSTDDFPYSSVGKAIAMSIVFGS
tara:strand:- start:556 stop:867 length:312 start_codon:yes stop_codon:yes gene_type:complete